MSALLAPFPYFGGKRSIAEEVWRRLGTPKQYIEPFCGSAAVLLAAPEIVSFEVVNDANGFIANFWRARTKGNVRMTVRDDIDAKLRATVLDPRPLAEPLPIGDVCAGKPGDPGCTCWYHLERAKLTTTQDKPKENDDDPTADRPGPTR